MRKNVLIYLLLFGLIVFFNSCEKDETKTVISSNPVAPSLKTLPNLILERTKGTDTLKFLGTAADPGFRASANYFLEIDTFGNQFKQPLIIASGIQDSVMKISVSTLNGMLIKRFPSDKTSSLEFRIRSVLVADAGTGSVPIVSISPVVTGNVTTYGFPRLDLVASGNVIGKITSPLADKQYFNFIKLNAGTSFTLKDPDTNVTYGTNGEEALAANGTPFTASNDGYYLVSADMTGLKYRFALCRLGVIGDATANGWNSPDTKMDFDSKSESWFVTLDLVVGSIKFRSNDNWTSIYNLGIGQGYSTENLSNGSSSANIPIAAAGNYTIRLYLNSTPLKCTITKNN